MGRSESGSAGDSIYLAFATGRTLSSKQVEEEFGIRYHLLRTLYRAGCLQRAVVGYRRYRWSRDELLDLFVHGKDYLGRDVDWKNLGVRGPKPTAVESAGGTDL